VDPGVVSGVINRVVFGALAQALFAVLPAVRYVALARGQNVSLQERLRPGDASSRESDRYEGLLVNPTLLTVARRAPGTPPWCRPAV
jgi:hypothetical protein